MTKPTKVFLVDDHAVVRRGLASYLDGEEDIAIIGQADGGRTALSELAVLANSGNLPDLVLMDLLMPEVDGIAATAQIKARWPDVAVLAVTSFVEEAKVRAALQAGASGYLLKDAEADEVATAIRAIAAGRVHLAPAAAATLVTAIRTPKPSRPELTPREREVVALVAQGRTNQQIATRLGVTERTARTHLSNILAKLGLTSRTQAAMWAAREGLANPP